MCSQPNLSIICRNLVLLVCCFQVLVNHLVGYSFPPTLKHVAYFLHKRKILFRNSSCTFLIYFSRLAVVHMLLKVIAYVSEARTWDSVASCWCQKKKLSVGSLVSFSSFFLALRWWFRLANDMSQIWVNLYISNCGS